MEQKVKQDAQKVMESSLNELHKKDSGKKQEYINIEQLIYGQTNKVETLQKNLKAKQIELENQIKKQLKDMRIILQIKCPKKMLKTLLKI